MSKVNKNSNVTLEQVVSGIEEQVWNELETEFACPYCGDRLQETWNACCGEAGHGQDLFMHEDASYSMNYDEATKFCREEALKRLMKQGESGVHALLQAYTAAQGSKV
jgi:hypothetical protein